MFARTLAAGALAAVTATSAMAVPLTLPTEQAETSGVVGISIPFGGDMRPRFSVGVRRTTVDVNGDLRGTELRLIFDPANPGNVQVRALGLLGSVDHAGALGGGWNFGTGKAFVSGGVVFPYLSGVVDFGLGGFQPQLTIGIDSLGKMDQPIAAPIF